ncbi:uncharacterized protein ASPGLDRAFT_46603 [Aspergillus glaucus CBS 516.65]|uniref:Uncharacterized protein n=1 Tax=Aspergillus glaucus CBS 516.65 TaxID=1160497 RepID=A0A1L9VLD2_ASPGL|nr:hypothetical protein ASPGLDRAFT_46603 [Aspergillus glaucus CBS 516.65]OJJ84705.1 hypothetical protein ASPGLDRAFT_46603 [Aspergillus glaucus CBS 516.65]
MLWSCDCILEKNRRAGRDLNWYRRAQCLCAVSAHFVALHLRSHNISWRASCECSAALEANSIERVARLGHDKLTCSSSSRSGRRSGSDSY